jgi:hypothetical protein
MRTAPKADIQQGREAGHRAHKYDPVADGRGGFPMRWGRGLTSPGGHYTEINNLQRGLKNDMAAVRRVDALSVSRISEPCDP